MRGQGASARGRFRERERDIVSRERVCVCGERERCFFDAEVVSRERACEGERRDSSVRETKRNSDIAETLQYQVSTSTRISLHLVRRHRRRTGQLTWK